MNDGVRTWIGVGWEGGRRRVTHRIAAGERGLEEMGTGTSDTEDTS